MTLYRFTLIKRLYHTTEKTSCQDLFLDFFKNMGTFVPPFFNDIRLRRILKNFKYSMIFVPVLPFFT